MSEAPLKVAILVVSTTAAKDPATDASEATLRAVLEKDAREGQWELVATRIVPDRADEIRKSVEQWTDGSENTAPANLLITTGGTGFAKDDITPEVNHIRSCSAYTLFRD